MNLLKTNPDYQADMNVMLISLSALMIFLSPLAYSENIPSPLSANSIQKSTPAEDSNPDCDVSNCRQVQSANFRNAPLGTRISDALTRQDREAAVDILDHENLLLNDEMNLLFLAGRKKEAANNAFTLMERSSLDESLYEQAAPILLANSQASGIKSTLYAFESYNAINTEASTTGQQMGRLTVDFSLYRETRDNLNTAKLTGLPNENGGKIGLYQVGDSYINTLKIHYSQALNTQTGISINHHHQVGSRLLLDTQIAYNQVATENEALRIMGRNNRVSFTGTYNLGNANQWLIEGAYNQYYSIDGQKLGSGNLLTSTLNHEISRVHPALHAHITGTLNKFNIADQVLTGITARLIPAREMNNAAYFMPQNVSEIAAYASLGDATNSRLPAHDLEYFFELGVFDNSATGPGWRANVGLAGRVMGSDRLRLHMRYDQSPSGQGFSSFEAGMAYLMFY